MQAPPAWKTKRASKVQSNTIAGRRALSTHRCALGLGFKRRSVLQDLKCNHRRGLWGAGGERFATVTALQLFTKNLGSAINCTPSYYTLSGEVF